MRNECGEKGASVTQRTRRVLASLLTVVLGLGCNGAGPSPSSPGCDETCRDAVALRAFRETLKQVFNGALQAKPVGAQDQTYACTPFGGSAHVTGTATSNPNVGTTTVNLTYVLDHCRYLAADTEPTQNYDITVTGTAMETGIIAVQPGTPTSLAITSDAMTLSGTVYSPPLPYPDHAGTEDAGAPSPCSMQLAQNGNQLSGTICGRTAGLTL
jgi:hypothetical protein